MATGPMWVPSSRRDRIHLESGANRPLPKLSLQNETLLSFATIRLSAPPT